MADECLVVGVSGRPVAVASSRLKRQRVVAAAIVLALHGAAFWWLATESVRLSMGPPSRQFDLTLIQPLRPAATTVIAAGERKSHTHAVAKTARRATAPRPRRGAPIDWDLELEREAHAGIAGSRTEKGPDFGFPHQRAARAPKPPEFGWDYARIHRIEVLPGALLIHLGERCVLAFVPLPFAACAIGTIRANGDLFKHLHDSHDPLDQSLP